MAKKKSVSIRSVPAMDYSFKWDAKRNSCVFRHKSGRGGETGCGVTDSVSAFSSADRIIVLAVNYPERYACIETYTGANGLDERVFAEPKDIDEIFGDDFASVSPKKIAERLAAEL
jgi:hypothetical protein